MMKNKNIIFYILLIFLILLVFFGYYTICKKDNVNKINATRFESANIDNLQNSIEDSNSVANSNTDANLDTKILLDGDTMYEKKISDKVSIRVVYAGAVLAQRSLIEIEKTTDGGATWKNQIEGDDPFIQIHNGAEFTFIDEDVGFINDPGLAGTAGDNRGLLVTNDGGKIFSDAILNTSKEDIYIDGVPYVEDGKLKLKAHNTMRDEKFYYYFYSEDNGKTWTTE